MARKIKWNDSENELDPDWKVRLCYELLLSTTTENVIGVENLWKKGPTRGRHMYPDYGKYITEHEMKVFRSVAPFAFAPKTE